MTCRSGRLYYPSLPTRARQPRPGTDRSIDFVNMLVLELDDADFISESRDVLFKAACEVYDNQLKEANIRDMSAPSLKQRRAGNTK